MANRHTVVVSIKDLKDLGSNPTLLRKFSGWSWAIQSISQDCWSKMEEEGMSYFEYPMGRKCIILFHSRMRRRDADNHQRKNKVRVGTGHSHLWSRSLGDDPTCDPGLQVMTTCTRGFLLVMCVVILGDLGKAGVLLFLDCPFVFNQNSTKWRPALQQFIIAWRDVSMHHCHSSDLFFPPLHPLKA